MYFIIMKRVWNLGKLILGIIIKYEKSFVLEVEVLFVKFIKIVLLFFFFGFMCERELDI